jgi:ERCC4-related helicase
MYVNNNYLKLNTVEEKGYQTKILNKIKPFNNFIVVMPTGSGKTILLIRYLSLMLETFSKVLVVAPKVILVQQHFNTFKTHLKNIKIILLLASTPNRLNFLSEQKIIIISTPHIISNETESIKEFFDIICFDEVHNLHINYPYKELLKKNCIKLGLTASPGLKLKSLQKILNAELYKLSETDYSPNITIKVEYTYLTNELYSIYNILRRVLNQYLNYIKLKKVDYKIINNLRTIYPANYVIGLKCVKLNHLINLICGQPIILSQEYLKKTTIKDLILKKDYLNYSSKIQSIKSFSDESYQKLSKILDLLTSNIFNTCIIFAKYRTSATFLNKELKKKGYSVALLLGQNKFINRKKQTETINLFKTHVVNILISTSVGYEGMDLPLVDLVIVHEITNTITQIIQQKGRTGRDGKSGTVIYLINKDTVEEQYYLRTIKYLS